MTAPIESSHGYLEKAVDGEPSSQPLESLKGFRKAFMLFFLCSAQFFDIFNAVSTIIALPEISKDLHFFPGALQWVVSAYTLTFATFLLFAGRLSDIYYPKLVFSLGYFAVGVFSILCAVSVHPIMLLVFRAMQGIGAAMTFPSALAMIMQHFPDSKEQGSALAIFGAFGAVGNVTGFILGGVLTARVSWRWIFYLVAIIIIPFSILSFIFLPNSSVSAKARQRRLDWQGVVALAGGLILFVYALSDGNNVGWKKPQIFVSLVFSVIFVVSFFLIERSVKDPAVPPRIWSNQNFLPLFLYSWSIYWSLNASELQLIQIFQDLWGWSALSAALHCIPIGVAGGVVSYLTGAFALHVPRRVLLIGGQLGMLVGTLLFALADSPAKYWSHIFPGMIIGLVGLAMAYVAANIFIMAGSRKGEEGVVGAMMNTAFQLGATVGLAGQ
ncbi:major facilitator superfamily domain-containing protein [Gautieria morchelliformis]|nr:major facilitator superfamily domain-containing protein [Gautieria morchelliformis]